jgi:DNA-binding CsgD family transcriptional regulator
MGQPPDQPPKEKGLSAHQSGKFASHGKTIYDPDAAPPERPGGLTAREEEIVELLADDLTNEEISKTTGTALATVKSHVHNILFKIKGKTRASAIIWSLRRQLAERDRRLEMKDREIRLLKELLAKGGCRFGAGAGLMMRPISVRTAAFANSSGALPKSGVPAAARGPLFPAGSGTPLAALGRSPSPKTRTRNRT